MFNANKSKIMIFDKHDKTRKLHNIEWTLGNNRLDIVESFTHLGIIQNPKFDHTDKIESACLKGLTKFYTVSDLGVRPRGLNPATSINIYKKQILPSMIYGCELWNGLKDKHVNKLSKTQHSIVKQIQGFTTSTRSDMCESLLGQQRIISEIDKRKLSFLHTISSLPNSSTAKRIFNRRLYLFHNATNDQQKGFIPDICSVLRHYNLHSHIDTNPLCLYLLPPKQDWKRTYTKTIRSYENAQLKNRMTMDQDFNRFRQLHRTYRTATIWTLPTTPNELFLCNKIAQILVNKPDDMIRFCSLCETTYTDTVRHATVDCLLTNDLRDTLMNNPLASTITNTLYSSNSDSEQILLRLLGKDLELDDDNRISLLETFAYITQAVSSFYHYVNDPP